MNMNAAALISKIAFAIEKVGDASVVVAYDGLDDGLPHRVKFNVIDVSWRESDNDDDDDAQVVIVVSHDEGTVIR